MVNYLIVPVPYLIFWFWFNQILSGGGGGGGGGLTEFSEKLGRTIFSDILISLI